MTLIDSMTDEISIRKPQKGRKQWILEIPARPVGKQSARITRKGRYIPDKSREFAGIIKVYAQQAGVTPIHHCIVDVHICLPIGLKERTTMPNVELEPRVRADEDNVRKGVKDALQGIAYLNDKNVLWGRNGYVFTDHGTMPKTRIIITECDWTDFRERTVPARISTDEKETKDESPFQFYK